ncbi:MAG: hypothetical protein ACPG5B_10150 [Chitinophagales bacterium]
MTLQELFDSFAGNPTPLIIYFILVPLTAFIANFMSGNEQYQSPWNYLYSTLVYLAAVPGILAVVLCIYTFFFESQRSLLEVNALVYFLPIIVMIATLLIIARHVNMNKIPGFNKLSAMLMMLTVTFITILIIQKTRIWVMFHGSVMHLFGLFVILFAVFMWGWSKFFSSSSSEKPTSHTNNREIEW